jgi:hypothetical protein
VALKNSFEKAFILIKLIAVRRQKKTQRRISTFLTPSTLKKNLSSGIKEIKYKNPVILEKDKLKALKGTSVSKLREKKNRKRVNLCNKFK